MASSNVLQLAQHVSGLAGVETRPLPFKPISADSHVTEPPNCYRDHIDPAFRDRAPYVATGPGGGDVVVIEGMPGGTQSIGYGGMAAAGLDPKEIAMGAMKFEEVHPGGWNGKARIEAQDRDGIGGEVIYPSVGMALCGHPDLALQQACFAAYNRWLQEFQSAAPDRLFGLGQSAAVSVDQTVKDIERIKDMGFCGIMLPCEPPGELEYDDPLFDPVWAAAVALDMPIAFHILTSRRTKRVSTVRANEKGRTMAHFHHTLIRANQDVIGTFIWGGVFERFPGLKLVCAEADAGWAPHFMYRLDHFYHRHRFHQGVVDMERLPSQQFAENVYLTFQDDAVALNNLDILNPRRLMWANDFPHSDATWPWSRQLLARQTASLGEDERQCILRDNVVEAFNLPV